MIELMILYTLYKNSMTMYAIHSSIHKTFGTYSKPSFGAIKPALDRLKEENSIEVRQKMSDGGKLSGFYTITEKGKDKLKALTLEPISDNPLQFQSVAAIKISCATYLSPESRKELFNTIKNKAYEHKIYAEEILKDDKKLDFYARIMIDNTIMEYKNFINLVENFEKDLGKI